MENPSRQNRDRSGEGKSARRPAPNVWILLAIIAVMGLTFYALRGPRTSLVPYSFFLDQIAKDNVIQVELGEQDATGLFKDPPKEPVQYNDEGKLVQGKDRTLHKRFRVVLPRDSDSRGRLTNLLEAKGVLYKNQPTSNALVMFYILVLLVPLALFAFFWFSYRRSRDQIMG
ncbi:MAG: hypothetical protein FJ276_07560, partial [Planctomycetes bacterium]|nr:hypothetical protein [Planctomycetota bacterium]